MSRDRLIVVDACLPKRLASRLKERKREAVSAASLNLDRHLDPDLLRELAQRYNDKQAWVLVTGDDSMPAEHGAVIIETRATIATIHPEYPAEMTEHHWRIDVVQRFAHAIQSQEPEAVRRYALNGSVPWTPRRRHVRQIAKYGWTPWREEDARQAQEKRAGPEGARPATSQMPDRLPGLD